jgi:hypothetical protein
VFTFFPSGPADRGKQTNTYPNTQINKRKRQSARGKRRQGKQDSDVNKDADKRRNAKRVNKHKKPYQTHSHITISICKQMRRKERQLVPPYHGAEGCNTTLSDQSVSFFVSSNPLASHRDHAN